MTIIEKPDEMILSCVFHHDVQFLGWEIQQWDAEPFRRFGELLLYENENQDQIAA
jgi:hypothetical protein